MILLLQFIFFNSSHTETISEFHQRINLPDYIHEQSSIVCKSSKYLFSEVYCSEIEVKVKVVWWKWKFGIYSISHGLHVVTYAVLSL